MVWHRSRSWTRFEAPNPWQDRDAVFLLLRTTSALGDPRRRWICRPHSLLRATRGDGNHSSHQSHTWTTRDRISQKSPAKSWRTSKCSGYPVHLIPRTSFRAISVHFEPRNTSVAHGTSRTQGRGVRTADMDRDLASRLPEERTRTIANAMENTRKVPRRSREWLSWWYFPWS